MAPIKVAILDDYQGLADPYFEKLDSAKYDVVSIKDTLLPYNHPDNPQSGKDELVQRLQPFDVICMQPFSPSVRASSSSKNRWLNMIL